MITAAILGKIVATAIILIVLSILFDPNCDTFFFSLIIVAGLATIAACGIGLIWVL